MTDSFGDIDGKIIAQKPVSAMNLQQIKVCLQSFVGEPEEQVPPIYCALKYKGKRLCRLARAGIVVARKARLITIDEIIL